MKKSVRRIDVMTRDQIIVELVRIAAYCHETYFLNGKVAGELCKTVSGARQQGEAIGRRQICAAVNDDFSETFGIVYQSDLEG